MERLLRRERLIVGAGLALLVVLAWAWLFAGAGMGALMGAMPGMDDMPMAEMPGMQLSWTVTTWALIDRATGRLLRVRPEIAERFLSDTSGT